MSHASIAADYDQVVITATAMTVDASLINAHRQIREYRWLQAEALWNLRRRPTKDTDYLYRYADPECHSWGQFCDDPRRPGRMTANKLIRLHDFYVVQHGLKPSLDCGIDRLYLLIKRPYPQAPTFPLWEADKNEVTEALVNTEVLGRDDWAVWFATKYPPQATKTAQNQVQSNPLVFFNTALELAQSHSVLLPENTPIPNSTMVTVIRPISEMQAPVNESRIIMQKMLQWLQLFLQGEPDRKMAELLAEQIQFILEVP